MTTRPVREILLDFSEINKPSKKDYVDFERDLRTAIADELEGEKVIIDSNNRRVKWESYNDAISDCQSHIVNGGKVNVKDKGSR